ncbi:MAG: glycosyltransferase family 1 protein, partial [Dolichospermum sp.]
MNKKPLRIALFTGLYAPFLTGVSVAVHQRVHWLLKQGHEVFLIHPEINDQYPPQVGKRPMSGIEELETFINFSAYSFPTEPLIFYKSLPQPLNSRHWSDTKLLTHFQPDIIVVEEAPQMRGLY